MKTITSEVEEYKKLTYRFMKFMDYIVSRCEKLKNEHIEALNETPGVITPDK